MKGTVPLQVHHNETLKSPIHIWIGLYFVCLIWILFYRKQQSIGIVSPYGFESKLRQYTALVGFQFTPPCQGYSRFNFVTLIREIYLYSGCELVKKLYKSIQEPCRQNDQLVLYVNEIDVALPHEREATKIERINLLNICECVATHTSKRWLSI